MDAATAPMMRRRERALDRLTGWLRAGGVPFVDMTTAPPSPFIPGFACPDILIGGISPLAITVMLQDREGDLLFLEAVRLAEIAAYEHLFGMPAFVANFTSDTAVPGFWFRPALLHQVPAQAVAGGRLLEVPAMAGFTVSTAGEAGAALAAARAWLPAENGPTTALL